VSGKVPTGLSEFTSVDRVTKMPHDEYLFINVSDLPLGHSPNTMFNLINNVLSNIASGQQYHISAPFVTGNEKHQLSIRVSVLDPDDDPDCYGEEGCEEYVGMFDIGNQDANDND